MKKVILEYVIYVWTYRSKKLTRSKAVARIADRTADASQHTKPTCIWVTT